MAHPSPRAIVLLLIATLLIGFAQVALLPPFEGFDESAHYSYVQQLAETGHVPRNGDPVSADISDYLKIAPTTALLRPARTYAELFAAPAAFATARAAIHDPPAVARAWRPGASANWQAQHPPLYYLAMAPAYLASRSWSLGGQLFLMRGVSYLLAWAGLTLAAYLAWRDRHDRAAPVALTIALWPLLFPMWFPEMARLGNDSLVILLVACCWPLARRLIGGAGCLFDYAALGALLGLALLTKATVLPFAAVVIAAILFQTYGAGALRARALPLLLMLVVLSLTCGWWYLLKLIETGSVIGSNDVAQMHNEGGLLAGLARNASLFLLAKIPWVLGISFLWGGTWSFVLPPLATILPLAATALIVALGYWLTWRNHALSLAEHVPALTWAAFVAAFFYHSLVLISTGHTGAPGWYLHSFAPALAPAVALGIAGAISSILRPVLSVLIFYPLAFLPIAFAVQAAFFSGCGAMPADGGYLPFATLAVCASRLDAIAGSLAAITFPGVVAILLLAGWCVALAGVVIAVRELNACKPA